MTMDHKAYEFSWIAFQGELAPVLHAALAGPDIAVLKRFVSHNLGQCKNPYDGTPLISRWKELLENGDVQEVADFALTKYYDPNDDFGLAGLWGEVYDSLSPLQQQALLGRPLGPPNNLFDPGRQGSYFNPPDLLKSSIEALAVVPLEEIRAYRARLAFSAQRCKGVYVTF